MNTIYYPKRLFSRDRQINCQCMCHESGPATEHGPGEKCPCKVGGWHEEAEWEIVGGDGE